VNHEKKCFVNILINKSLISTTMLFAFLTELVFLLFQTPIDIIGYIEKGIIDEKENNFTTI